MSQQIKISRSKILGGFTLIEILVAITVATGILFVVGTFSINILNFNNVLTPTFQAQQELNLTLQSMALEIQSMSPSSIGSYSISQVGTSTITFFSDIDDDGLFEQIRYFLSGTTLKKGVLKPTGSPLSYVVANEKINDVVHDIYISNPVIFSYYDGNYTGSESPLPYPVDISKIRLIGVDLFVKNSNLNSPISFSLKLMPRNLRGN